MTFFFELVGFCYGSYPISSRIFGGICSPVYAVEIFFEGYLYGFSAGRSLYDGFHFDCFKKILVKYHAVPVVERCFYRDSVADICYILYCLLDIYGIEIKLCYLTVIIVCLFERYYPVSVSGVYQLHKRVGSCGGYVYRFKFSAGAFYMLIVRCYLYLTPFRCSYHRRKLFERE